MRKLNVLMLTSSYPVGGNISGPFVQNIANGLVRKGASVTVMMFSSSHKFKKYHNHGATIIEYPYSLFLPHALHKHKGLIPTVRKSFLAKIEFPLYLISTFYHLRKFSKNFDVVHAHWYFPSGFIAALNKRFSKKPLVTTAWGAEFHLPNNFVTRKILNYVHKNSDAKIAVSKYMKSKAKEYGLNIKDMKVIPNSVDVKQFSLKRKKSDKIIIATVRRLVPEKRILDLIKAVGLLSNDLRKKISLWIIGDGPEKGKLINLTKELGLDSITKFWGMVPHKEIPELLSKVDIYVNPSIQEGMATANLEAMAAGACVIVTKGVGNDEMITNGKTGFLYEAKNVGQLSTILKRHTKNYPRSTGNNARRRVEKNFSIDKIADKYIMIYKTTIKKTIKQSSS